MGLSVAVVVLNCVLNILFSLSAIALNSVTIHAIRKTSAARLPRILRMFLLSLALSDLGVGLIAQPFIVVLHLDWLLEKPYQTTAKDVDAFGIMAGLSIYASMLNVMALTTDRFLGVHLHLRHEEIATVKRVACCGGSYHLGVEWSSFISTFVDHLSCFLSSLQCSFNCSLPLNNSVTSLQDTCSRATTRECDLGPARKCAESQFNFH